MDFLDLTLDTAAANLAADEALLIAAETGAGPELLRVWEWSRPAVVLGSGCRLADDVDEVNCGADGVPILRRSSGGGTVLLGRGCLLFTLILDYRRSPRLEGIASSYGYILDRIREALPDVAPGAELVGTSDLAVAGRKFSGNAQQRKRTHLLHHGTLLYDFDLPGIGRYLRAPDRQPDYRAGRSHADFLMNLPAGAEALKRRLRAVWNADEPLPAWPEDRVAALVRDKYAVREWIRRF
jgi:lipoate---protein ligase